MRTIGSFKCVFQMKRACQIILFLQFLIFSFNCKTVGKQTLGSDYYLMGDKENAASIKLVHGVHDGFDDVILGEIVDYDTDPYFILIHRKVTDKAKAMFEDNPLWQKQLNGKLTDQYWIIEKSIDGITGPLNFQEYLAKRKQLNISDGVKIRQ